MNECNMRRPGVGLYLLLALLAASQAGCGGQEPQGRGWDFAKVDASGEVLAAANADDHRCVLDRRTGLLWEVKQEAPGLHHRDALFSWHNPDGAENGGEAGPAGGGQCALARCDTDAFVAAVNEAGLCGRDDWRMPSRDEALTLLDPARIGKGAALDPAYFPQAVEAEYWTATTFRLYPRGAWAIDTIYAQDRVDWKYTLKRARLVNGSKTAVKPKGRGR